MAETDKPLHGDAGEAEKKSPLRFRLYVVDSAPNSVQAMANFRKFCEECLGTDYELEIVDVMEQPLRALDDGVLITPALVRLTPPIVRIIGNLSDGGRVRRSLGFGSG